MSLTNLAGRFFLSRQNDLRQYLTGAVHMQQEVLQHLLARGKDTEYGRTISSA